METLVFRSKIDGLMYAIFAITIVPVVYAAIPAIAHSKNMNWWAMLVLGMVTVGLPVWLVITTRYELGASELKIISGPLRYRVPLASVRDIKPTDNAMASPALSLDRLRIEYGEHKAIMISPRDKAEFLRVFAERRAMALKP